MLQLLQNLGTGATTLADVPAPTAADGTLLIATRRTLVSAGTERMLVDFGRASLIDKARQQPDKVKMVLDKIRTDGLFATLDAVRSKLDQPLALGYSNVGVVLEAGRGVEGFAAGDRVASNGPHAEVVRVPVNLCAKVPDAVDDESAAFTVLASISLQGIRLAAPTLGETFVVTGLGLIGLTTVQLLRANGCRVLGVDLDPGRLELARALGAEVCNPGGEDVVERGLLFSGRRGVDGVIVTASTQSSEPIAQAAQMSRKRGRIVLVGVTGLELNRADFYEKELTFQVSCSYGPGRYDAAYELHGQDYPVGFVRWTEQRNFEAALQLMAEGRVDVHPLISHRFAIGDATRAYDTLVGDRNALGIVLAYEGSADATALRVRGKPLAEPPVAGPGDPVLAVVGAGNYGSRILIPAFKQAGARLDTLVTHTGVSGYHHGKKAGFAFASTDFSSSVLTNSRINAVAIATRHDSHARLAADCLSAGLHVFVEKPLAITHEGIVEIETARATANAAGRSPMLMVGFNRRFAPLAVKLKGLLAPISAPKAIIYTVNAGAIPPDHWTQQSAVGGGRIVGEACHFIDLIRHLAGHAIVGHRVATMGGSASRDSATITLQFEDESIGTVHYFANGGRRFPKERVEVFCNGGVLVLDNFQRLIGHDWRGFTSMRGWKQDKGQSECAAAFVNAVRAGGPAPIPWSEIIEVSRAAIDVADAQS